MTLPLSRVGFGSSLQHTPYDFILSLSMDSINLSVMEVSVFPSNAHETLLGGSISKPNFSHPGSRIVKRRIDISLKCLIVELIDKCLPTSGYIHLGVFTSLYGGYMYSFLRFSD